MVNYKMELLVVIYAGHKKTAKIAV